MTQFTDIQTYRRWGTVIFLKTHELYGGLSNMAAGYPLTINGTRILTSEALYQACRFPHRPEVQKLIIEQASPMAAKMKSKPYRKDSRPDWEQVNVDIMRWCLRVKLAQNWERFGELLRSTGERPIIEESKRDSFWGAKATDTATLVGRNALGQLLMELRDQLRGPDPETLRAVQPLPLPDFRFLGQPIGVIESSDQGAWPHSISHVQTPKPIQQLAFDTPLAAVAGNAHPVSPASPKLQPTPVQEPAMNPTPQPRKKLIEVALPLEAINKESAREKSIRHGHPSTLHLWWARRPLAACRAVLFASLVDDPSSCSEEFPTEAEQEAERLRLFDIIEDLVKWENSNDEAVLHRARTEIARSAARTHGVSLPRSLTPPEVAEALRKYAPPILDPFAGGGSIPLEGQRLGLEAHASDLNPVAVLINKALIEIPPKFANRPPVHPEENKTLLQREWHGAEGLAEDVRYYGEWIRNEAWKRIGHLYPKVPLPKEQGGGEATVIAWLWARTVTCPNPACGAQMPLVHSFTFSARKGNEVSGKPVIEHVTKTVSFEICRGLKAPEATVNRKGANCVVCSTLVPLDHIRSEGQAGRLGIKMMAIVTEGKGGRVFLPASKEHEEISGKAIPTWKPDAVLPNNTRDIRPQLYGMTTYGDLFTPRQLAVLNTFSDLVSKVWEKALIDAQRAGMNDDRIPVSEDGTGAQAYADAIATYLAFAIDKVADRHSTICAWDSSPSKLQLGHTFSRQAIPMIWDFAEGNPFCMSSGTWTPSVDWIAKALEYLPKAEPGISQQKDANSASKDILHPHISTDPPYYDNIGYADLSDFFYVWLRHSLGRIYPDLFATLLVPKTQELVAASYRFGGDKQKANGFFEEGLSKVFSHMQTAQHPAYPLTVFYAFKQSESTEDHESGNDSIGVSTGWETMLTSLLQARFSITGTWPMRTEMANRSISLDSNALASSIVLVCRPRLEGASATSRSEFLRALKRELPAALKDLQRGNIAPVDLAQAAIGPGMAVFSRYSKVLESDGSPMRVRIALQLINHALDEVLAEQEGEYDADTRWAVAWFEQYGMEDGPYGVAETLSKAKNTAVERLVEAGILAAKGGKVRLLRREELSEHWNPARQARLTVWEATQRLIRALDKEGEQGAAAVLDGVGGLGEIARDLAYRLYTTCERKGWTQDARDYNTLVVEWRGIAGQAERLPKTVQASFGQDF